MDTTDIRNKENKPPLKNPFKLVINTFLVLLFFLLLIYLGIRSFQLFGEPSYRDKVDALLVDYLAFIRQAWSFVKPLVQLVIILAIVDWLLKRLGITLFNERTRFEWNVQTIIAIILVSAFAMVALGGGDILALKDLALVVVGFYFGSQKRETRNDPPAVITEKKDED